MVMFPYEGSILEQDEKQKPINQFVNKASRFHEINNIQK